MQSAMNSFAKWAKRRKLALSELKSVHVDFALRPHHYKPVFVNGLQILCNDSTKYLGMDLDERLNYKVHMTKKRKELNLRLRQVY